MLHITRNDGHRLALGIGYSSSRHLQQLRNYCYDCLDPSSCNLHWAYQDQNLTFSYCSEAAHAQLLTLVARYSSPSSKVVLNGFGVFQYSRTTFISCQEATSQGPIPNFLTKISRHCTQIVEKHPKISKDYQQTPKSFQNLDISSLDRTVFWIVVRK